MPASGRKRTTLSTAASDMAPAPQQRAGNSQQHQRRIEVQAAGLDAAEQSGGAATEGAEAVQRAVDQQTVGQAQEDAVRDPDQRPVDGAVVELVDVVLGQQ